MVLADGTCCSNLHVLDGSTVFSPLENREDDFLAGVNMESFIQDLNLNVGDELRITFEFTETLFPNCVIICNRHNGLRIEVLSVEKL